MIHITFPHCDEVNRVPSSKLSKHPKCGSCHQLLFIGKPLELASKNFSNLISKTEISTVVDFGHLGAGYVKL